MKVVHLSQTDAGAGAGRAAYRIHRSLFEQGVDSTMIVGDKRAPDDSVLLALPGWLGRSRSRVSAVLEAKLTRHLTRRGMGYCSPAVFQVFDPSLDARVRAADVVCLYWTNGGFIRPEGLARLAMPVVWRLSDTWPFTGGCHYPGDCQGFIEACGECPMLRKSGSNDRSRQLWERKSKAWRDTDLTIVAPSRWMFSLAQGSALFRDRRIEYLATGIDTDIFRPQDKAQARAKLGLPSERRLLVFGAAGSIRDARKGWRELVQAIELIVRRGQGKEWHIVAFGTDELPLLPLSATAVGTLTDDAQLAQLYASADVVAVPSLEDNLPQVALEALGCGTPVVAFRIGGIPDAIVHGHSGWMAERGDIKGFADGLIWAMSSGEATRVAARQHAETNFSHKTQAVRYLELLSGLAYGHGGGNEKA